MWTLLFGVTFGILALSSAEPAQGVKSRSCSYDGVFHVEGPDRYKLTFDLASQLCEGLGVTLANEDQIVAAHGRGMETCRYGWVSSQKAAILRHKPNGICSKNMTGVLYHLFSPDQKLDAYCFDSEAGAGENCEKVINPDSVNEKDGDSVADITVLTTVGSGAIQDVHEEAQTPAPEAGDPTAPETPLHSAVTADPAGADPDAQDFTSTPGAEVKETPAKPELITVLREEELATPAGPEEAEPATERPTGEEEPTEGDHTQGTGPTRDPHMVLAELDDTTGSGMAPSLADEGEATVMPVREPAETPETTRQVEGEEKMEEKEEEKVEEKMEEKMEDKVEDKVEEKMEDKVEDKVEDKDGPASAQPKAGRMGPGAPPTPAGREDTASNWVLIVGVLVAVGAILLVCAAVAKRKSWCGQRQSLTISSKEGGGEGNGAAAAVGGSLAQEREQEMVTLMNKEKIQENGNAEEFTVITLEEEESPEKEQLA